MKTFTEIILKNIHKGLKKQNKFQPVFGHQADMLWCSERAEPLTTTSHGHQSHTFPIVDYLT